MSWTVACQALLLAEIFLLRIQEQVAISFSRGSSGPRDQTCVSCRFFTAEPPGKPIVLLDHCVSIVSVLVRSASCFGEGGWDLRSLNTIEQIFVNSLRNYD